MAKKKVGFSWNIDQLNAVQSAVHQYLQCLGNSTEEQLAGVILKRLAEKLAGKSLFPERENKVSLKQDEMLALQLAAERVELQELGNYEAVVMLQFLYQLN